MGVGAFALATGCVSTPFDPTVAVPSAAPVATNVAASRAPASAAPKPPASAAPKPPAATPVPYQYNSFYFTHPATWKLTTEVRNPARLVLEPTEGDAEFRVRELPNTKSFAGERTRVVAEVGIGLISNAATTLDCAPGFLIIWNRTEDGNSRYHATRGFVYKEAYFELEANWNRPSPEMNQVSADVAAILKSWIWQ